MMANVTKEKVLLAIDKIPPDMLKDAWLYLEFLASRAGSGNESSNPEYTELEGAFPELDIPFEEIEAILDNDRHQRLSRLL